MIEFLLYISLVVSLYILWLKFQSIKIKEKYYIRLTQKNSIKFLIQDIYISLVICIQLYVIYFKDYVFYIRPIYSDYAIIVLEFSTFFSML